MYVNVKSMYNILSLCINDTLAAVMPHIQTIYRMFLATCSSNSCQHASRQLAILSQRLDPVDHRTILPYFKNCTLVVAMTMGSQCNDEVVNAKICKAFAASANSFQANPSALRFIQIAICCWERLVSDGLSQSFHFGVWVSAVRALDHDRRSCCHSSLFS